MVEILSELGSLERFEVEPGLIGLRSPALAELGLPLPGGNKPTAQDYALLLDSAKGRPDEHLIQTVLLRSMQQAMYSSDNVGHFGLAYDAYTHFTSPIRRDPDLIVHRIIKHILNNFRICTRKNI